MAPKPSPRDSELTPHTKALAEQYHKLAMRIAWDTWKTIPNGVYEINDLLSIATEGLVDAALRWNCYCEENGYDPEDISYFHTFVQRNVKGALYDYFRSEDYVTRAIRDKSREINKLLAAGRTQQEAAADLQMTQVELRTVLAAIANTPWSRDTAFSEPQYLVEFPQTTTYEFIGYVDGIDSAVEVSYLLDAFASIIDSMPVNKQAVLALRYYAEMDLGEIATFLSLTGSAVQKLHTDAIMQIKEKMEQVASDSD